MAVQKIDGIPINAFMTTEEVAEALRFTVTSSNPGQSAWKWIKRNNLERFNRGRRVLVLRNAVEAAVEGR